MIALGALLLQATVAHVPLDTTQPVAVHALASPDTVYVGQQITYEVGVFIDDQMRFRLRHNPEFLPPEPQGMLAYDLPAGGTDAAREAVIRKAGGHTYDVHLFRRALFPLVPGEYTIPRAQLIYSLPLSLSFFSREEAHTILAESLTVAVRALPRPPPSERAVEYAGAVGELSIGASVDSARARVGNPLVLTVRVFGRGNVPLLPRPTYTVPWATLIAAQERVHMDSASADVRGAKEFDWLLTPRQSGSLTLPPIAYEFFDPYSARYEVAVAPAETLRVAPGTLVALDTVRADTTHPLSIRTRYHGTLGAPLYRSPAFALLAVVAPVFPAGLAVWRRRSRAKRRAAISPTLRLQALARRRQPIDVIVLRHTYIDALTDRFGLPAAAFTDRGALAQALEDRGTPPDSAREVEAVLALLDTRAFGEQAASLRSAQGAEVSGDLCTRAYEAFEAVVAHGGRRDTGTTGERTSLIAGIICAATVGGVLGRAPTSASDTEAFNAGVAAYAGRQYLAAAEYFAATVRLAPGAPNAWADAGTAAWALGDTADAVVGWQRAGRIDPLARDVRDRLALVRAPQDGAIAMLPPVPSGLAANLALVLWLIACGIPTWRLSREIAGIGSLTAGSLACAAGAFGILAVWTHSIAAARDLAVVGSGAALYEAPALAAQRTVQLDAGDIVRLIERQGVWDRVRLDGDREGWIEGTHLTPLADVR